ncbi:MAG: barstar family protein [Ornithinibacter sp.]
MIRHLGPLTDVDGLVADAREEGREVHLVVAGPTKQATLAAFAEALDFPAWFGGNLDALADCLGHLARNADGEHELVLDGVAELARDDPFTFADLSGLLGQVAAAHPGFHVTVVDR